MSVAPASSTTRTGPGPQWWLLAAVEVTLAVSVVLLDLLLPTVVLLGLWGVSSLVRREGPAQVGLRPPGRPGAMVAQVLGLSVAWTAVVYAVVTPAVEQLSDERRDVQPFAPLEDNLPLLGLMLVLSWTLAAVGEEVAYRGYLMTRVQQLLQRTGPAAPVAAAVVSSVTFGLAHSEQGVVGVVLTTLDGLLYAALRYRYATVWASVLAHGTINTIGMTAYYLAGPVPSPW
jgi:membrane protease YdiL (CAAX protease family)